MVETEQMEKNEDNKFNEQKGIIKEEVKLQFHLYITLFMMLYVGSFIPSAILFMLYIIFFFIPSFLDNPNFFALFTELKPLVALLVMPLIIIISYLLHLFFIALIMRFFWKITEKKSPSKDGIIPRNIPSKILNFYHIRSFLIKYPKNVFIKGAFPWLSNWFFNFIGSSKIGKGTTIEEQIAGDRFIDIGKNCYIGVNSTLTSHLVEGTFGNIPYFKIKIGDNVTLSGLSIVAPGCEIGDNAYILPLSAAAKFNILKGNNYYFGLPLRRIFKKKIMEYLELTEEDLNKDKVKRMEQQQK